MLRGARPERRVRCLFVASSPRGVDPYDPSEHHEFRQMIETKLRLEIRYESIYGGEGFTVVYPQRGLVSSLPAGDGHAGGEPI
jgi:hypothetical protein